MDNWKSIFFYVFLDLMNKSSVSGICNVLKELIIFLHVSCLMNGLSVSLFSTMKGQYILWPLKGRQLCSLGLVETGLSRSCLEELGGLADRDPEHGAVSDVAQDASVAALWRSLRRGGGSQWARFVTPSAAHLQEKDIKRGEGGGGIWGNVILNYREK